MSSLRYTTITHNTVADNIYEGEILNDNNLATKTYDEHWQKHDLDFLYTNLPVAITEKKAWDTFWNKYEIYVGYLSNEDEHEPEEPKHSHNFGKNANFVFIDYIGPENNKKVYACSPTNGLWTLSVVNDELVVHQELTNGCCHIVYAEGPISRSSSTSVGRFIICSDNRTTMGTDKCFMLWDGTSSTPNKTIVRYIDNTETILPFHTAAYGRLWWDSTNSKEVNGFILGARTYNTDNQNQQTGYGGWYFRQDDISDIEAGGNIYSLILRVPAYASNQGAGIYGNGNSYVIADIKQLNFHYNDGPESGSSSQYSNRLWIIATGGNANSWGEDVLIAQIGNNSLGQFYRFRFRSENDNQKCAKILYSEAAYYEFYEKRGSPEVNYKTYGNGIGVICCYDSNINPYWFPGSFHPADDQTKTYSNDNFKIVKFYGNLSNDQWLSCCDLSHFGLIGGGGHNVAKFEFTITQAGGDGRAKYMYRNIALLQNVNDTFTVNKFLDMDVLNGNVYLCGNGGVIKIKDLDSLYYATADNAEVSEILVENGSITMNDATNDGTYIYAIGYAPNGNDRDGVAIVVNKGSFDNINSSSSGSSNSGSNNSGSSESTTGEEDTFRVRCELTSSQIVSMYSSLETILDEIKTNSNYATAYQKLVNCRDADIVNYITGRTQHLKEYNGYS